MTDFMLFRMEFDMISYTEIENLMLSNFHVLFSGETGLLYSIRRLACALEGVGKSVVIQQYLNTARGL